MGLEPVSQPMPTTVTQSIVDVLNSCPHPPTSVAAVSALFPNMSAVPTSESGQSPQAKIPKSEYKPEQLATLLQAAASQGGSATTLTPVMSSTSTGLTVTPTSGNFHNSFNGTSLYKQSFGGHAANGGNASFPPTATLLQNQTNVIQNGNKIRIRILNIEPEMSIFFRTQCRCLTQTTIAESQIERY